MAMNQDGKTQYMYLNRDGLWSGFECQGLCRRADGALELIPLPQLEGTVPQSIKEADAPSGPSGIAVAADGTVYFSEPRGRRIRQIAGCDGAVCPLPCLGGGTGMPGRFLTPRGLLLSKNRRALFAADSGHHRVQIFDPDTGQLLAILGQPNPGSPPAPGSGPGRLNAPWGLAGDSEDGVYVLDYGNARVQKWNAAGDLVGRFWDNVKASNLLIRPLDICAADVNGAIRVFVAEGSSLQIFVFDANGEPVAGPDGNPLVIGAGWLQAPLGMAASSHALYVGDNVARRVFQFSLGDKPAFAGEARGYEGPVAALGLDARGNLWVHAGLADPPLQLRVDAAFATKGFIWTPQPVQTDHPKVVWQRLQAEMQPLPANTHLDFLVYTSNSTANPPKVLEGSEDPLSDPKWRQAPHGPAADLDDIYVGGEPATYLWLAAQLSGDGGGTPVLSQVRVQFDRDSYLDYLPAIYRDETRCGDFLLRFLSLFESVYQDVEGEIRGLPVLFDAKTTPKEFLGWLAEWLGLELDESWSEVKQRQILAQIFRLYGHRGTASGLRLMLKLFAGVDAVIEEPILNAAWWALPSAPTSCCDTCAGAAAGSTADWRDTQSSILGFTTMLAPAQPQGAVVGTSAVLDQSHLTTVDEFGAPLFGDVAYQFSVQVYRGQVMCGDVLPRIRALVDEEKPAHTTYQLCIVEPRMRVGYQSRVGVDTVVGGLSRSLALGSEQVLGEDTVLAGPPATRLDQSRLGISTRLG
jgi:phage tail-like protein